MQPRPMRALAGEGGRRPWIGANFWSREGGPRMWSRYDGDIVRQELRSLNSFTGIKFNTTEYTFFNLFS